MRVPASILLTEQQPLRRFAHLAIRPYPEELERACELNNGTQVLLRPIKPEDEPLWHKNDGRLLAGVDPISFSPLVPSDVA